MEKIIIPIVLIVLISSCVGGLKTSKLSKSEMSKFQVRNDTVIYSGNPIAVYTNCEWEYYRGKKTLELSFDRLGHGVDVSTDKILDYIHTRYPKAKAEVKIPKVYDIK